MKVGQMNLAPEDAPALSGLTWDYPFLLSQKLGQEERMMAEAANTYAQEKLHSRVTGAFANETTGPSVLQEMGEMGLLGLPLPEKYGGLGASYVTYDLLRVKLIASIQVIGQ